MTTIKEYKRKTTHAVKALQVTADLFEPPYEQLWLGCARNIRDKTVTVDIGSRYKAVAYIGDYIVCNHYGTLSAMSQEQFNEVYE